MGEERWFYRSAEEWIALAEQLKQTPCPHCKVVGALIRHGYAAMTSATPSARPSAHGGSFVAG